MANQEKDTFSSSHEFNKNELKELGDKQQEQLRENIERRVENHENKENSAKHEALEQAEKMEREQRQHEAKQDVNTERRPLTKKERNKAREASFHATMEAVQSQMPKASQAFSRIIHNKTGEKVSDAAGNTIARPNAILAGAVFAFALTLVVYLIARYYGYPLSGTETIASFAFGWILGNVFDYVRILVIGKDH